MDETDRLLQETADEAERELHRIAQGPTARETMKRLAKKAAGRTVPDRDRISWPAGLLLLGLWEAGREETVRAYLDAWIRDGAPVHRIDDAVTGYCLLRCYEKYPTEEYRAAVEAMMKFFREAPVDEEGSLIYQPTHAGSYVLADGAGQSAMFLGAYGSLFHDASAAEMARRQILNFWKSGTDRNTGLMYHGYNRSGVKQGIIGWGRAAGWLLCGWSVALSCAEKSGQRTAVPDGKARPQESGENLEAAPLCSRKAGMDPEGGSAPAPEMFAAGFRQLEENVLRYLRQDHLFSWQLEAMEGPADTSATGMIGWALVHAHRSGVVFDYDESAMLETASTLTEQINGGRVYGSSAECIDFAQYPQQYGNNAWGQGAALMFLSALQSNENGREIC